MDQASNVNFLGDFYVLKKALEKNRGCESLFKKKLSDLYTVFKKEILCNTVENYAFQEIIFLYFLVLSF